MGELVAVDTTDRRPEPVRDGWGRYLARAPWDPDTAKPRGRQRVTTLNKKVADPTGLERWKLRMAVAGMAMRDDLVASAAGLDVDNGDDKTTLSKIADQALEHAGASRKASIGTALHRYVEAVNRGEDIQVPAQWQADIDAYRTAIAGWGVGHLERVTICRELDVMGTFDMVLERDGRTYIADLKTGNIDYNLPEIAVQLAIYAHGAGLAIVTDGQPITRWEPMPDVDQTVGYVIHLPAGEGRCELIPVDLEVGWRGALLAAEVRDWQKLKRKDVEATVATSAPPGDTSPPVSVDPTPIAGTADGAPPETATPGVRHNLTTSQPPGPADPAHAQRLLARIGRLDDTAKQALRDDWGDIPSLRQPSHTMTDIAMIEALIGDHDIEPLCIRAAALPPDLLAALDAKVERGDIVNLSKQGHRTADDLDAVSAAIEDAEIVAAERLNQRTLALSGLPEPTARWAQRITLGDGVLFLEPIDNLAHDRLMALCEALDEGVVEPDTGTAHESRLVDAHDGKRAVNQVARRIATEHDLDVPPGGAAGICTEPVLAALVWAEGAA